MSNSIRIRARITDLWADELGWSENASWSREVIVTVPASSSDLTIVRKIKAALGIQGMRKSDWCRSDFGPWRYQGIGAYADIEESEVNP